MAAQTFTLFKDNFRIDYGRNPTLEETWKAAKAAEALKPSHNTGSPKLPTLVELKDRLMSINWSGYDIVSAEAGVNRCYDLICRQLRAGA